MNSPILVLRLSRRAVAAVSLSGEDLTLFDGLHLRSQRHAALVGLRRYVQRLIDIIQPKTIVVDAPKKAGSQTDALFDVLTDALRERHVALTEMGSATVLTAFGFPPLASRRQLRVVAEPLFAELATFRKPIKPYILDAAASALLVESASALGSEAQ